MTSPQGEGHRFALVLEADEGASPNQARIGLDAESGNIHSLVSTPANVNDVTQADALLHSDDANAFGEAYYHGVYKREEAEGPQWHIAMQSAQRNQLSGSPLGQVLEKVEKIKASIRAKVEHPIHVIKNLLRHRKNRYRSLAKNHAQLFSLSGLANQMATKRRLLAVHGGGAS